MTPDKKNEKTDFWVKSDQRPDTVGDDSCSPNRSSFHTQMMILYEKDMLPFFPRLVHTPCVRKSMYVEVRKVSTAKQQVQTPYSLPPPSCPRPSPAPSVPRPSPVRVSSPPRPALVPPLSFPRPSPFLPLLLSICVVSLYIIYFVHLYIRILNNNNARRQLIFLENKEPHCSYYSIRN